MLVNVVAHSVIGPIGVELHFEVTTEVYMLPGNVTVEPLPGWVTIEVETLPGNVTVGPLPGCVTTDV